MKVPSLTSNRSTKRSNLIRERRLMNRRAVSNSPRRNASRAGWVLHTARETARGSCFFKPSRSSKALCAPLPGGKEGIWKLFSLPPADVITSRVTPEL